MRADGAAVVQVHVDQCGNRQLQPARPKPRRQQAFNLRVADQRHAPHAGQRASGGGGGLRLNVAGDAVSLDDLNGDPARHLRA
jgi:hypothetical protein